MDNYCDLVKLRNRFFLDISVWGQMSSENIEKIRLVLMNDLEKEVLRIKSKVITYIQSFDPFIVERSLSSLLIDARHDEFKDKVVNLLNFRDYFILKYSNRNKETSLFKEKYVEIFEETFDVYYSAHQEVADYLAELLYKCQKGEFINDERIKKDFLRSILKRKPTFVLDPNFPISQLIYKADGNMLIQFGYEEIAILFLYLRKHNLILDLDNVALSEFLSLLTGLSAKQLVTEIRAVNVYFDEDKPKKQNSVGDYKENFKNVINALKVILEEMESKI